MKGPQLVMSPVRLLPPCHVRVTGSHEGSPSSDNVLGVLGPGEDQEVARATAHVMYQLLKCLLEWGGETGTQGRDPGPAEVSGAHPTHRMAGASDQPCHPPACRPKALGGVVLMPHPPHPEKPGIS